MRAAVIDSTDTIVNVIVVDDLTFDPGPGLTLVAVPDDLGVDTQWGYIDGEFIKPPHRFLEATPATIPADGVTASTVTYTDTHDDAPVEVTFTVNGLAETVAVTGGVASVEVVSVHAGDAIRVTCNPHGFEVAIRVEEN